jgi:hypothetical protein
MLRSFPFGFKQTITALVLSAFVASGVSATTRPATDRQDVMVNRSHKGGRLTHALANGRWEPGPISNKVIFQVTRVPLGCDRSFSPLAQPEFAHVFRRCIT